MAECDVVTVPSQSTDAGALDTDPGQRRSFARSLQEGRFGVIQSWIS